MNPLTQPQQISRTPTSIKVLGQKYHVIPIDDGVSNASGDNAWVDHNDLEIRLLETLTAQKKAECLMHEVVHAIYYAMNLSSKSSEEDVAERLARGLQCVAADNPEFWSWFLIHSVTCN